MKRAVVLDLDGTLLSCNTFGKYVRYLMFHYPSMIFISLIRKMRLISHETAKRLIMNVNVSEDRINLFIDTLLPFLRRELLGRFKGYEIILATAAPEGYVKILAQRLGINRFCATKKNGPENKGEEKLKNVVGILSKENMELYAVVTDHHDDLPLLEYNTCGENYLMAPDRETRLELNSKKVRYSELFG